MGFIGRILPVFIGWLIWRKTGNIIFGALVAVLLESLLGPVLNEIGLMFVKALKIENADDVPAGDEGKGARVLVGVKTGVDTDLDSMVEKAEKELSSDAANAKFAGMLAALREAGLPEYRYKCEYKAKNNGEITKTFREFRKIPDVAALKTTEDHFFGYDEPSGDFFVAWLFSQEIPIPEDAPESAPDSLPEISTETAAETGAEIKKAAEDEV